MSYIVWSHRCRKCKGQFYLEENEDGKYLTCIQCGHSEVFVEPAPGQELSEDQPTPTTDSGKELAQV
jgi:DNA-directed RNA polymerase subunit RPC12/RpoP